MGNAATSRIRIYKDKDGDWRWTLYAPNNRKVAVSGEGYENKAHAERMARKLFPWMFDDFTDPPFVPEPKRKR